MDLFIFRRDFRIFDNTTLNLLNNVIPIFIFDPIQIDNNPYFSNNSVQFLCESLEDLKKQISKKGGKLYIFYGDTFETLQKILSLVDIKTIGFNQDYTPFSIQRDEKIKQLFSNVLSEQDCVLNPVGTVKTGSNTFYSKFTPYYNKAKIIEIPKPKTKKIKFIKVSVLDKLTIDNLKQFYSENPNILHHGGRTLALKQLNLIKKQKEYNDTRNIPSIPTSEISAYNKYGCFSIREVYEKCRKTIGLENGLVRQLYFRDFYYNVVYSHPEVLSGKPFIKRFENIVWDDKYFEEFKTGQTGFPIIDAGIRQLLKTGFIHNRVRMLCASFLSKDLLIDWRKGEKYFAQMLYDYDPAQNSGGWQSTVGVGASALDWFQVMNPWTQTLKFDPECKYIKEWIPELKDVPNEVILNWEKEEYECDYPRPIVNHDERRLIFLERFKK